MRKIGNVLKVLFLMYVVTLVLLLLLALVMYKMEPGEMLFSVWLIAVYVISGFFGGFLIGKCMKSQKFLWGIGVGTAYFGILLVVSMLLHSGIHGDMTHLLTTFILCAASGTVGGMVS
ncbi:MAG: TIGR04086 family membrane protein [Lachnospiraceae bacterium]|nr:TIGR04086 family membrane protein [Lachnospiraceae bacterium]